MEKKGFTPLQSASIIFIVVFVLGPFALELVYTIMSYLPVPETTVQVCFFLALACAVVTWLIKKLKEQRAHLAALHEQADLLTDQVNLLAEHINALEAATGVSLPAETPADEPTTDGSDQEALK